jgi:hypothetical protein
MRILSLTEWGGSLIYHCLKRIEVLFSFFSILFIIIILNTTCSIR